MAYRIKLRTVRTIVVATPVPLLCVAGGGGVDTTPAVGISPASAEIDTTHVRISAKASRFIFEFLLSKSYQKSGIGR